MPVTAFNHFRQDIARARAIVAHADTLPMDSDEQLLRCDLLRSGWMFAVGALDAYFCDAYTDIVAATIISKNRQPTITLPEFFYDIKFPVSAILESYLNNPNWRWRMAARKMMERENVLQLRTIQTLFNRFCRPNRRFFMHLLQDWIIAPDSKRRLFGITRAAYLALPPVDQQTAVNDAWDQMQERYCNFFQPRHDCIHNCDRPRVSPQRLDRSATVVKVIQDVEFLVRHCDDHIRKEFRNFLAGLGGTAATIAQAGY